MDIDQRVERTDLTSLITGLGDLLVGMEGVVPSEAIGSRVFVADRLIMTVKHVIKGYWQLYGNPNGVLERPRKSCTD